MVKFFGPTFGQNVERSLIVKLSSQLMAIQTQSGWSGCGPMVVRFFWQNVLVRITRSYRSHFPAVSRRFLQWRHARLRILSHEGGQTGNRGSFLTDWINEEIVGCGSRIWTYDLQVMRRKVKHLWYWFNWIITRYSKLCVRFCVSNLRLHAFFASFCVNPLTQN